MAKDILGMLQARPSHLKVSKPQTETKQKGLESKIRQVPASVNIVPKKSSNGFKNRWRVDGTHLIYNVPRDLDRTNYEQENAKYKVAAFDLDWTVVKTKSGGTHPRGPQDWVFWNPSVKDKIRDLVKQKYIIVLFSNQGAVVVNNSGPKSKSYQNFADRVDYIFEALKEAIGEQFDLFVFAAPKRPGAKHARPSTEARHLHMRKPQPGMWEALKAHLELLDEDAEIDIENSLFVGDAAGRPNDFLDSDKAFARNINVGGFFTPEDFF